MGSGLPSLYSIKDIALVEVSGLSFGTLSLPDSGPTGIFWSGFAPSAQREYTQVISFENRDLQIRELKHSCYSLFQGVLSEHPDLAEQAPYNPKEAFLYGLIRPEARPAGPAAARLVRMGKRRSGTPLVRYSEAGAPRRGARLCHKHDFLVLE